MLLTFRIPWNPWCRPKCKHSKVLWTCGKYKCPWLKMLISNKLINYCGYKPIRVYLFFQLDSYECKLPGTCSNYCVIFDLNDTAITWKWNIHYLFISINLKLRIATEKLVTYNFSYKNYEKYYSDNNRLFWKYECTHWICALNKKYNQARSCKRGDNQIYFVTYKKYRICN